MGNQAENRTLALCHLPLCGCKVVTHRTSNLKPRRRHDRGFFFELRPAIRRVPQLGRFAMSRNLPVGLPRQSGLSSAAPPGPTLSVPRETAPEGKMVQASEGLTRVAGRQFTRAASITQNELDVFQARLPALFPQRRPPKQCTRLPLRWETIAESKRRLLARAHTSDHFRPRERLANGLLHWLNPICDRRMPLNWRPIHCLARHLPASGLKFHHFTCAAADSVEIRLIENNQFV